VLLSVLIDIESHKHKRVSASRILRRMEQTKNKGGRPPVPPEQRLVQRSIRLPPDLWAKIDAHGLEWLRAVIRRARPPAG